MSASWTLSLREMSEVPEDFRLASPIEQREVLIAGEIRRWNGPLRESLSAVELRDDQGVHPVVVGRYPSMGPDDAREALEAAVRAFDRGRGPWPAMSVANRIRSVEDFLFRMQERRDEIVKLLMWEVGKSLADSRKEFDRTIQYVRDTIDALKELDRVSSRFRIEEGIIGQIRRSPLGVVLCMGPFNYPLNETFTTLIPALIMGNTVVFKPPRFGVLLYHPLLEAFRDSFPPGVINTVYGDGSTIIGPLMQSGKIDVLAFIGSSRVADVLRKEHPHPHRLRAVLGLDAKNAAIVLADADLELAVKECVQGTLSFNGQRCTALKLLFVHQSILDAFLERFSAEVAKLRIGQPWDEGVSLTPLPDPKKPAYLRELVDDALAKGATVVNAGGGEVHGRVFTPALLSPVGTTMRVYHEEQFGPVVPVVPFSDVEEALEAIVHSSYGQQASVFGRDPDTVAQLVDVLVNQVCRVNLNAQCQRGPDTFPFTGRKDSAEGTLSVSDALRVFSIRTLVAAKEGDASKHLITEILRGRRSSFLSTDFLL
ncbi:MAG: NADP-dependent glyceraldehyde-3-phosphate dehydrogenase [Polyangiales bacterium]